MDGVDLQTKEVVLVKGELYLLVNRCAWQLSKLLTEPDKLYDLVTNNIQETNNYLPLQYPETGQE